MGVHSSLVGNVCLWGTIDDDTWHFDIATLVKSVAVHGIGHV